LRELDLGSTSSLSWGRELVLSNDDSGRQHKSYRNPKPLACTF
jgi:hypothetical protein